jgi:hypothetical protein
MHIEVNTDNSTEGSEALTSHVKGLVQHELAHFEEHITRVEVHLSDAGTGTTGQEEKHCTIEARLKGQQPTAAKDAAVTLELATKGAAAKLKNVLESTLGKLAERR